MEKTIIDPILFEILRHRIEEIVAEAYYTISRVSGNAVIAEVGDHEEALLDAHGNTVMVAGGIVEWTSVLGAAAKHLIKAYEDNPGIKEEDQFIFNHAYLAAVHAMDVQVLAPVFWKGKRVAWVVAAGHTHDVGGQDPGGQQMRATEFYQEGLQIPGLLIMEGGRIRRDVEDTIKTMVRQPDIFMLDVSAKVAANNASTARLIEMINKYGIDVTLATFGQLQDYSEALARAKLRRVPDGTWHTVHYMESLIDEEFSLKAELTLTKEDDTLTFDFTGSSPQSKGSQNIAEPGAISNVLCSYLTCFAYDIPWSEGVWKPLKFVLPKGTIMNPVFPAPTSSNTPLGVGPLLIDVAQDAISKMLLCTEDFREDAYANAAKGHHCTLWYGYNSKGEFFETETFEHIIGGMGALAYRDGDDACANMWTPKSMVANVELNEQLFPILYLDRAEAVDTGGPGKFRGGVTNKHAQITWKAKEFWVRDHGYGQIPRSGTGLAGGYPAPNVMQWIVKNSNIPERLKKGDFPRNYDEIGGDWEVMPIFALRKLEPGDILIQYEGGGGGYGDPIERDPDLVLKDVKLGYVSLEAAKKSYGVVIYPEKLEVNINKTRELRAKIISRRKQPGKN